MASVVASASSPTSGSISLPLDISAGEADDCLISDAAKKRREVLEDEVNKVLKSESESSSAHQHSATDMAKPIPLGSVVELKFDFICATLPVEVEYLREFVAAGKEGNQQQAVHGRLHIIGGASQRSVASAVISAETKHCDSHTCFRLQTDKGSPVMLRFELSPDVVTNPLPQLSLEIRTRRSQKRKVSLSIACAYLLKKLAIGVEYQINAQLLDDQDRPCGRLSTSCRGGLQPDLENCDQTWTTVVLEPEACMLTVRVSDLQASQNEGKDARCFAKIWSSTTGKTRGQIVSPLVWKNEEAAIENGEAKAVSLQVADAASEIIFVGIYRYSTHERNELIGLGSFTIYPLNLPTGTENQPVEQSVRLYSESAGKENECGSAILSLQTTPAPQEDDTDKLVSLAATGLGSIAYPVQSGEMKCRIDVDILEVQALPSNVSEGDSVSIQLRIAQSNWKAELAAAKVVLAADGSKRLAPAGENAHTVICWAAKDRSFPVLEVFVYVLPQQKPNRIGMASRASLATTSHAKRSQISIGAQRANEALTPALMATGSLNLSSLFLQQNVSVLIDLRLDVEKTFVDIDTERERGLEKVSLLSRLRASSSQGNGAKSPAPLGFSNAVSQPVNGDVCVHLLQASGNVFRKMSSRSSYYVVVSVGPQEVRSSCCTIDDAYMLTWNQQLALSLACSGPSIIHLTLYHRALDSISPSECDTASQRRSNDQIIGYLTLPLLPSVLEEDHLVQLQLPFGTPMNLESGEAAKQSNDPHYYKRGMLSLELQFLPTEQPKAGPTIPSDVFELVIHRVRGNLQDASGSQRPLCIAKHVYIDISIVNDRGDSAEELAVGATGVIPLSSSGLTEVSEVVDLSNPIVAAALSNGSSNVLVGRIRDLIGNNYGRVHLPLRKDWKKRLVHRKKQVWCPICQESLNAAVTVTKDAVLMSLQIRQQSDPIPQSNALGKFHINVYEAILVTHFESSNLMKLGKYGGANVQLTYASTKDFTNVIRSRTRQSIAQNNSQHWIWEKEWVTFPHVGESQELQVGFEISNHLRLDGKFDLSSAIEDAALRRLDVWVPLSNQAVSDGPMASAHLHVVIVYLPTIVGTLSMEFGESYAFSESERMLHVENIFYKCTIHNTSFSSAVVAEDTLESTTTDVLAGSCYTQLRLPLDTRLDAASGIPEFVIQRMGVTKSLGEFCLGVLSLDFLSMSNLCCFVASSGEPRERFTWCEFTDKSDRTKTTGVAKLRVGFDHTLITLTGTPTPGRAKTLETRVELFTIWKKLFYLLDQNGNGFIDRTEFTSVFVDHLEDMKGTSDGQMLLQLLFGDNDNQDNSLVPTPQQITTVFSVMDTNRDNEIEWSEYLHFLQQKQQQLFAKMHEKEENPVTDTHEPASEQKRELRRKNREDGRPAPSSSGEQSIIESTDQGGVPPEAVREVKAVLKQEPAAPKRPGKASSREEKLLKLQYSNQEQSRLQQQINSLETILAIERRRYAELAADRQALMRSYQQLHLKHQNELIQEQTKAKWMKQTIERQQQQLEERETLRQKRDQASTVLQSTLRSRLEHKRYQGLKLQRATAAISIQCLVRRVKAGQQLQVLQERDRVAKQRFRAASTMQRFLRFHVHRKERALLLEARTLSATILQKNARRMLAGNTWRGQKVAVLQLQCWVRQRLAAKRLNRLQNATSVVKTAVLGWFARRQYDQRKASSHKLQRWWKRASKERAAYMELLEAVLCIQSALKRMSARKWYEREWQRQEKYLSQLEATICIQAAWRGRQQRLMGIRGTPRFEDDSAIEALLYELVAMVEAEVVVPADKEQSAATRATGAPSESSSMESLVGHDKAPSSAAEEASFSENELVVGDVTIGTVVAVFLNDLVEAAVGSSEDAVGMPHEDDSGDQSYPEPASVSEQDIVSDLKEVESGGHELAPPPGGDDIASSAAAHCEMADGPDLGIIRNLLEDIKAIVVSSTAGANSINTTRSIDGVPTVKDHPVRDLQHDSSSDNAHEIQTEVALQGFAPMSPDPTGHTNDLPATDVELPEMFAGTAVGDFTMPSASDSGESNNDSDAEGSSIDSTDLMMEADAMAIMPDESDHPFIPESTSHTRKTTTRMDSADLLADLDQLNVHDN
ncbi:hypothetical protein PHYPSEUDO_011594 [Phytophthora pseudosyringae]|uniref:EF-hand domain-containing protein n=1 Tax=Phytophthora pseudosyringae TaxID=221518 RepID=A0A8T1W5Z0_9STRA|nr:hypothetical protein PHYPSEUDO_011594 [Phytophthora pseudosyringae]